MNVLILAAGQSTASHWDDYPLCLSELDGVPLIQRIFDSCLSIPDVRFIVAIRSEDSRRYHLDNTVRLLADGAKVVQVPDSTQGAACTALLAINYIDNDEELLILNGNELLDEDFSSVISESRHRRLAAAVITFSSVHPRYSYVRVNEAGNVVEAAEKNPISRHATAGFYWFAKGSYFVRAAQSTIRKGAAVNGHYYICPVLNELILEQLPIGTHAVKVNQYRPLKTEQQIAQLNASMIQRGVVD
jgi:dTDP-glucose pyrophosphorylase